jgi:hypothetical protein
MLSVIYAECHYAECHYAECHYAECGYAECRSAKFWRYKFYEILRLCQKKPKVNLIHILRL